jgi:ornithine--oxo-acid transaminase
MGKTVSFAEETAVSDLRYQEHVNPQWVRLLDALQMNVRYGRCSGVELHAEDVRRFLDFLSGYCVHNTGHNHPEIVTALQRELGREGPAMLQSHVSDLAGDLAQRLCSLADPSTKYFSAAPEAKASKRRSNSHARTPDGRD